MKSDKKIMSNTGEYPETEASKKIFDGKFWAGILVGVVLAGLVISGTGVYLYNSTNATVADVRQKIDQLLSQEQERQQAVFASNMNELVERQSVAFEKLASEAQNSISTEFDQKFTAIVDMELSRIFAVQMQADQDQAEQAFLLASQLVEEGRISEAGVYISNALYKDPSNVGYLSGYVELISQWAKGVSDADEEYAIQVLSELESFSTAQLMHINVNDIEQGRLILTEIKAERSALMASVSRREQDHILLVAEAAITRWEKLGTIPDTTIDTQLEGYRDQLISILSDLDVVSVNQMDLERDSIYALVVEYLRQVDALRQILSACTQAEKYMERGQQEEIDRESRLRLLSQSEAIVNQMLIASADLTPSVKGRVFMLKRNSDSAVKMESVRYSKEIFADMKEEKASHKYLPFKKPKGFKYQDAIVDLGVLVNQLSVSAQGITDQSVLEDATELIMEINDERKKWVEEQYNKYNLWASETAQDFFNQYKSHLKLKKNKDGTMGANEVLLARQLLTRFGPIDIRLLGAPAAQARNEVFNLFYSELTNEQKVEVASKLVTFKKRKLSDI